MRPTTLLSCFGCLVGLAACANDNLTVPDDHGYYNPDSGTPGLSCLPNQDGQIDAKEMTPTYDQSVSFLVKSLPTADPSPGYDVNTEGVVNNEGRRVWDWSGDDSTWLKASITAHELKDQWYAKSFPGATFAGPLDLAGQLDALYSYDQTALKLFGVASSTENPPEGKTLLTYKEPVVFFPFPLVMGKQWTSVGVVENGTDLGITPWSQTDTYEMEVDDTGELRLPHFTFKQVLRVSIKATVKPAAGSEPIYQRQVIFLYECFGEVARAASVYFKASEPDPGKNFTQAREVRKLGYF